MLQEFITSALIIDDKVNEIEKLEEYLDSVGIWAKHYTPEMLNERTSNFNNRKLIFLDLYIDESDTSVEGNISKIRKHFEKVLGKEFGSYGIALWSKDPEQVKIFSAKIFNTGGKYTRPLFVVALDKAKYLQSNDFSNLISDLEIQLSKDVSASFFVEWNKAVKYGSDKTISTLYNLFDTNDKKNKHLESILYKLAQNYTGIPLNISNKIEDKGEIERIKSYLQKDLVKSLMDSLQVEISNSYQIVETLFQEINKLNYNEDAEEKSKVFSKLNSLLLLDFDNLLDDSPIPGNIYEVSDNNLPIYIKEIIYKKVIQDLDTHKDFINFKIRRICIELTPPCDFAQNKKQSFSRIVGGIQLDFDNNIMNHITTENYYKYLYPVSMPGYDNPQMVILDFYRFQTINEVELKDKNKYKIIAKTKNKLFADILQKLSSHTARLGIAIINK